MKNQKTWFITGASRGFGLEIVNAALATGDQVVATVRNNGGEFQNHLSENANLLLVIMDVTVEDQVQSAVQQAIDKFGKIDVLVNNAGYGLLAGR